MTRRPSPPIKDAPDRLRQRFRASGSWRIWWEPEAAVRKLGFEVVEFDAGAPMKACRGARDLNDQVALARVTGGAPQPRRGLICIEDVAEDYLRSMQFLGLVRQTRASYRGAIRLIIRKWGDVAAVDITKPMMRTWYETLYRDAGKFQALQLIRLMSVLMSHAELRGWRPEQSNPCYRLGVSVPKPRKRVVDWAEFDALIAAADRVGLPSIGLVASLSMLAGQRLTDCMAALRGDFEERKVVWPGTENPASVWVWFVDRSKTGAEGALLLHAELAPLVATVLVRPAPADAKLIIEERVGRAYDMDLFQKRWGEVRAAAVAGGAGAQPCESLADVQFRDLRRSFAVHARRGGASVDDAGDALGNSVGTNDRLKDTYMPPDFFTAARAVAAVNRPAKNTRKIA